MAGWLALLFLLVSGEYSYEEMSMSCGSGACGF
jgi:hypothetical protein